MQWNFKLLASTNTHVKEYFISKKGRLFLKIFFHMCKSSHMPNLITIIDLKKIRQMDEVDIYASLYWKSIFSLDMITHV
jgi:hypothetical protein